MPSKEIEAELSRINDEGTDFMQGGQPAAAAEKFSEALALDPSHPQSWYNLGVVKQDLGDPEGAIACYSQAVTHDPTFVNAWSNIGWTMLEMGQIDHAEDMFEAAIDANPDYAKSYVGKASICLERQDPLNARLYCAMALERDPFSPKAHLLLSLLDEEAT